MRARMRVLTGVLLACLAYAPFAAPAQSPAAQPLQVSISAAPTGISGSYQLMLRFHNAGAAPLWLYEPAAEAGGEDALAGGSSLAAHLESASTTSLSKPAVGTALEAAGFPHPRLVAVAPGGDQIETVAMNIAPGTGASGASYWGAYHLSVVYSAAYPNGDSIRRNLGVDLWSGSVMSNSVEITLSPPSSADSGEISGGVTERDGRMAAGIIVSLTDDRERLVQQLITDPSGRFHFAHLPFGRYWVTVRRDGAEDDTSFFEHADLSPSSPAAALKLMMLKPEVYEGKQMLHKPVLIRVRDGSGSPVDSATLAILWSDGSVTESMRLETNPEGIISTALIPGTNYITLSKRHCHKNDQSSEIAPGGGVDSVNLTYDCGK